MHGEIAQLPLVVACDVVRSGALRIATQAALPDTDDKDAPIPAAPGATPWPKPSTRA